MKVVYFLSDPFFYSDNFPPMFLDKKSEIHSYENTAYLK